MGISRQLMQELRDLLRPMQTRLANTVARGIVKLVADSKKLQELQLGVLSGETVDDAERFQQYGFTSVPLSGAEAVVIFPNGDRAHALVVAVDDRRYRPTGLPPGTVCLYAPAGKEVRLGAGDAADPVIRKSDLDAVVSAFNSHTHPGTGMTAGGDPVVGSTAVPSAMTAPAGSPKVKVE